MNSYPDFRLSTTYTHGVIVQTTFVNIQSVQQAVKAQVAVHLRENVGGSEKSRLLVWNGRQV